MNFYGYKLESKNVERIDRLIGEIKGLVRARAQALYVSLLSTEIEILTDEIVRGLHDKEKLVSVFDESVQLLNKKISVAIARGFDTEYNFAVSINLFTYNKEAYIQVASYNRDLIRVISDAKTMKLEDLTVDETLDDKTREAREKLWTGIVAEYNDHSCFNVNIFPLHDSFDKPDFETLKFKKPDQRAAVLARHRYTNRCLSMYAGGGDVPPGKLMEYLDQAFIKETGADAAEIIEAFKLELMAFLPVITKDIVMTKFNEEAPLKAQIVKAASKKDEAEESEPNENAGNDPPEVNEDKK